MQIVARSTPYYSSVRNRPIVGAVIHSTETLVDVLPHPNGSWHYQITRAGVIYQEMPESVVAWHVRACDRWRPPWMLTSRGNYSDANYCTLGIELVSHAHYREAGQPYTAAQYTALRELVADIQARRGPLPWVGHGQLQNDRTDPVELDWVRAGFGPFVPEWGYPALLDFPGEEPETVPILNDDQTLYVAQRLWGDIPFTPGFALPNSWVQEWRANRYRGRPLGGEETLPDGAGVCQRFEHGLAVWLPEAGVSWNG